VTATATVDLGGGNYGSTSEFAQNSIAILANIAPSGADNAINVTEDTNYVLTLADFGFSDIDGDDLMQVNFTTTPSSGTLNYNGTPFTAPNFVSKQDIIDGRLTYSPATNANGNAFTSFTFQVQDDGGTANGGQDTDQSPNTITINISQINDAGTFGGNTSATTNEDTATAGTVTFADTADGYSSNNFVLAADAINGTATIDSNGNWTYTPDANYHGSDSFTVQVTDDDGNTENLATFITVTPVNDAGTFGGNTLLMLPMDTQGIPLLLIPLPPMVSQQLMQQVIGLTPLPLTLMVAIRSPFK